MKKLILLLAAFGLSTTAFSSNLGIKGGEGNHVTQSIYASGGNHANEDVNGGEGNHQSESPDGFDGNH